MTANLWTVLESMPSKEFERAVREAEDAGLEGIWIPQVFSPPFPAMAAAAMVSTRLRIGSGVEMATTFMVAGTRDEVRERIEKLGRAADSLTLVPPGTGGTLPGERVRVYQQAIVETFYPARDPQGHRL